MCSWASFKSDVRSKGLWHALSNLGKSDRYVLEEDGIHRIGGLFVRDRVLPLDHIVSWRVEYEMVFDIVRIELQDGSILTWFDYYNDLLGILRAEAGERYRE